MVVGLEAQKLLEKRKTKDFSIVHLWGVAGTVDEFAVAGGDAGVDKGIIDCRVDRDNDVFKRRSWQGRHDKALRW
jgi:hypothetical protein